MALPCFVCAGRSALSDWAAMTIPADDRNALRFIATAASFSIIGSDTHAVHGVGAEDAGFGWLAVLPSVMPKAQRIASKYILRISGSSQASSVWPSVE